MSSAVSSHHRSPRNMVSSHPHPTAASQGDLDVLAMLTGDTAPSASGMGMGMGMNRTGGAQNSKKKVLPRRDGPIESLMLSAVLAGSGQVSRHHFGHGAVRPNAYASCDESRPSSPSRGAATSPPKGAAMRSMQAPRSERLRRESKISPIPQHGESSTSPRSIGGVGGSVGGAGGSGSGSGNSHRASFSSSLAQDRPKRRLSIDPAPISATLQASSPPNFLRPSSHAYSTSTSPSISGLVHSPSKPKTNRPQVRCMARTRVPTPHGEVFLHLYHNNIDKKEHLAIVLDPIQLSADARRSAPMGRREIRSKSLDEEWRDGETDMERVVRGAYVGRLGPGGEDQASVAPNKNANGNGKTLGNGRINEEEELDLDSDVDVDVDGLSLHISDTRPESDILPLVRIHSECFTGETIGSMRCDCGEQLDEAIRLIAAPQRVRVRVSSSLPSRSPKHSALAPSPETETGMGTETYSPSTTSRTQTQSQTRTVPGRGVVIYMRQEGRGIGLLEKIRAYNLQDLGHDTVTANLMLGHGADERKYDVAAEILRDLGLGGGGVGAGVEAIAASEAEAGVETQSGIRLLTNNPEKVEGLAREGVIVRERVPMVPRDWKCSGQDDEDPAAHGRSGAGAGAGAGDSSDSQQKEYEEYRDRRSGVGLIGGGRTHGVELERYLRTKVERMGHILDLPESK